MNKIMKRFGAVCISIFMVFTLCMPCFADETQKTIRVDLLKIHLIMWMIMVLGVVMVMS